MNKRPHKLSAIGIWIENAKTAWNDSVGKWWSENVSPWFTKEKWLEQWDNIKEAFKTAWNNVKTAWDNNVVKWWNDNVAPWFTKEKWQEQWDNIKKAANDMWQKLVDWWNNTAIVKWWNDNVAPWFTKEKWLELINKGIDGIKEGFDDFRQKYDKLKEWWNEKVAPWFTIEKWKELAQKGIDGLKQKWNDFKDNFNPIRDWWNDKVAPWFTWNKWRELAQDAINGIKNAFENLDIRIKLPHFTWTSTPAEGWIANVLSALNLPTNLPKLNVSWYAKGGFPDTGEFFMARENGIPEMVGRMGNRTAVANNDQIVAGISQGVYNAVVSAGAGSQPQQIVVNLGNKTLYSGFANGISSENNRYGKSIVEV